jgi:hypothetical protein
MILALPLSIVGLMVLGLRVVVGASPHVSALGETS